MVVLSAKRKESEGRHARDRAIMVARHLAARGIDDPLVLAAMGEVPREAFVPEHLHEFAYEDGALPIEAGQTRCLAEACSKGTGEPQRRRNFDRDRAIHRRA